MTVRKSENQIIIDAVTAMAIAMMDDVANTDIVVENSVIGLGPAILLKNESVERLAWISVHPGMMCPQVFLAKIEECANVDAPSIGFDSPEEAPQIMSLCFQRVNDDNGVHGFNCNNTHFADAVTTAAKMVVCWLISGTR